MDDPEYTFQILEVFSKVKSKEIPRELEEYISYVARTGDPVFQWSLVKVLIKEKLSAVLNEFVRESDGSLDIPTCPNVDAFDYEMMKTSLLNRLDTFILPPFTIQRICELLAAPRKEYNRIDKYMRAVEKNVLVVSASEYSLKRGLDAADGTDTVINGILYDKVNDSLNSFSNHVLSQEQEQQQRSNEMNVVGGGAGKVEEPDPVQRIIDQSWTEENGEAFRLNGSSDNSGLDVSFDNELRFVAGAGSDDKSVDEKDGSSSCDESSKEFDSSFDNSNMMIESSIQNIIDESGNVSFESVSKSDDSHFEESSLKNEDEDAATCEFKDDDGRDARCSVNEGANSSGEVEMFDVSGNEDSRMSVVAGDVSCNTDKKNDHRSDGSKPLEYEEDFAAPSRTDSPESLPSSSPRTKPDDHVVTTTEAETIADAEHGRGQADDHHRSSSEITFENANCSLNLIESREADEEAMAASSLCAGDNEKVDCEEDKDAAAVVEQQTAAAAETRADEPNYEAVEAERSSAEA